MQSGTVGCGVVIGCGFEGIIGVGVSMIECGLQTIIGCTSDHHMYWVWSCGTVGCGHEGIIGRSLSSHHHSQLTVDSLGFGVYEHEPWPGT